MVTKKANSTDAPDTQGLSGGSAPVGSKAEIMKQKLAGQEKVAIMIPLSPGEAEGSTDTVILNGYRLNIRKGVMVMVPMQVAQVIMESQQQTAQAIQNYFLMNEQGKSKAMKDKEVIN